MQTFKRARRFLLALSVSLPLAFGPIGCGPEVVPVVMTGIGLVGLTALTIHQIQEVGLARLDMELKTLQLQGLKDGKPVTIEQMVTPKQIQDIRSKGRMRINNQIVPVTFIR